MNIDLLNEMAMYIADGLQSNSLTSCFRWATKRRWMTGDFEGWYSDKHHPWVREMHNSEAPINYAMKGAQLGVTEVLINKAFYTIDQLKRDVLYVLPTAKNASDFSKARFNTALNSSAYLKSIFTDTNTIELKQAGTNTLYIRGSRGDSNLKSIPVSVLLLDEVDEMSQRAISLAIERLSGQLQKWIWGISTPTIPNFGIHKLFKDSTQEHFTFKCPCCGRQTELIWPHCFEIIGEGVYDIRCKESYLKCKECGGKLPHEAKPDWLRGSKWVVMNPAGNPEIRGFTISQMYSFTVTPGDLVTAYFKGFGDEAANVEFHNSKLGVPFIGDGAKVLDEDIDEVIGNYTQDGERPKAGGDRVICMGVDQGKMNYAEVTEYFFDRYSPDLNVAAKAKALYTLEFHEDDWYMIDELMRDWQVLACVMDADPNVNEARRFARRFPGYVYLCRYRRGVTAKEISVQDDGDYAPLLTVDRTNWMSAALGRFRKPRRIELPRDISHNYREHVKAPVRTYVRDEVGNPRATYVETGPDHFAHARTYCEIALPMAAAHSTGEDIGRFL